MQSFFFRAFTSKKLLLWQRIPVVKLINSYGFENLTLYPQLFLTTPTVCNCERWTALCILLLGLARKNCNHENFNFVRKKLLSEEMWPFALYRYREVFFHILRCSSWWSNISMCQNVWNYPECVSVTTFSEWGFVSVKKRIQLHNYAFVVGWIIRCSMCLILEKIAKKEFYEKIIYMHQIIPPNKCLLSIRSSIICQCH